jgi:hypothetical protein
LGGQDKIERGKWTWVGTQTAGIARPMVTSSVFSICTPLKFDDWGAHQLKGVPGEWRLFAVASP